MFNDRQPESVVKSFQKDQESLIGIWLDKLALIGCILVPLFSIVDAVFYPEKFYQFLQYRVIASASCIIIYFINRKWNLGRYRSHLAVVGYYIVGLSILIMIIDLGGYATPYYAGLNLVFIAFGVLFPLQVRTISLHCISLYLIYVISVILIDPMAPYQHDPALAQTNYPVQKMITLFVANNSFVISSLFIIIIASAVGQNLRFREYKTRMELEEAKLKLQKSNEMLEITLARKHRDLLENLREKKLVEEMKDNLEEQLLQSQKMEAIGRLAGGVAHDFNNILTIIKVNSELLLSRMENENPYRKKIDDIRGASERAANLTRQLLAFSRKQVLKPIELNFNKVIKNVKDMLQTLVGEAIVIKTDLAYELGDVRADPSQMEQVILNLVVNARDAMPRGGEITIRTSDVYVEDPQTDEDNSLQRGRYVLLTVSDTGVGMDKEVQSHIFEPFYTTKDVGKGTGLGLSTVYGIVKQSGGYITVNSNPGKGTQFNIYMPRLNQSRSVYISDDNLFTLKRGLETILLVEDDDYVRTLANEILEESGYNILEARSGNEAIHICKDYEGSIELLLTDVVMPQMSGSELAEIIMSLQPEIKVLYMSGYTDEAIVHHGILDSGITLLEKPFTAHTLTDKVREVLDGIQTTHR